MEVILLISVLSYGWHTATILSIITGLVWDYAYSLAFSTNIPFLACVQNTSQYCESSANSCGDPNGYIQCNGSCSAILVERSYYNTACTLYSNSNNCGVTNTASGRILLRPRYLHRLGAKCTPQINVPGIGSPCNINACGDPSGYLTCSSNGLSAICSAGRAALQLRHLLLLNLSSQRLRSDHHRCGKWHDWLRQLHLHRHSSRSPFKQWLCPNCPGGPRSRHRPRL